MATKNIVPRVDGEGGIGRSDKRWLSGSFMSGSFGRAESTIFSGSYIGDGSGLTGVTAEWDGTHIGDARFSGSASDVFVISGSNVDLTQTIAISGSTFSGSFIGNGAGLVGIQTASYITLAQTASYVTLAQTASYITLAQTASYVLNAISSSYAETASFALTSGGVGGLWTGSADQISRQGNVAISGSLFMSGSIIPDKRFAYDLGSPAKAWRKLYVSGSSIEFVSASTSIATIGATPNGNISMGKSTVEATGLIITGSVKFPSNVTTPTTSSNWAGTAVTSGSDVGGGTWHHQTSATGPPEGGSAGVTVSTVHFQPSNHLVLTNYGFSIPSSAIITGFKVDIVRKAGVNAGPGTFFRITDYGIYLTKRGANTTETGTNMSGYIDSSNHGTDWPITFETASFGSPSSSFGQLWTPTEINASTFGIDYQTEDGRASGITTNVGPFVDAIQISCYYYPGYGISNGNPGNFGELYVTSSNSWGDTADVQVICISKG